LENQLFILLGTNLGDRFQNLETARNEIEKNAGKITKFSGIYETEAWGITDQPSFLNQVLQISTDLKPNKILQIILIIEKKMGRIRDQKWGSRLIDIDILYLGNLKLIGNNLIIPHPFLHERRFTLAPLAEIAPDFIHPILQKTNLELLENCGDDSQVILMEK
jgi:2-amino-4-hydroxy-6-hydroxymethyldihydropteridine diphosphokinase